MTKTATAKPKPVKEKRRNNEKRKEKSRDAARCRRSRETEIFQELAGLLPMRQEDVDHLDKASVMRLSIAYLRVRDMLELFPTTSGGSKTDDKSKIKKSDAGGESHQNSDESEGSGEKKLDLGELAMENEKFVLQTLDGFLLVLSADGDVTYISENVSEYLGISQIDVMGQPIWEYSHQCDHEELREALNGRHHSPSELLKGVANSECKPLENRDFFLRLKCTLTSRGRSVNIKSASYKVIHVTGHIACKENGQRQLVAVARPLPHPSNIEVPLDSSTFLSKHSLDMKFTYVDDKMFNLLGYNPADLMGKPFYECHHGIDSENLMGTFKNVISKGQSETARYRFLACTGGYAWVVTQATLIYDKQKPHSIVCVNYVISGVENKDEIYSCAQLEARQQKSVAPQTTTTTKAAAAVPPVAAVVEPTVAPSDVVSTCSDKVLKENVNHSNTNNSKPLAIIAPADKDKNKPLKEVIKVLGPVSNSSSTVVRKVPYAAVAPTTARSVSVTASIFNTVTKKGPTPVTSAATATAAPARSDEIKSPARKIPQSVTAKLFVTLNPQQQQQQQPAVTTPTSAQLAAAASCNKPKHATEKIFAPRTKDMNKGFLMFSEEEPGLTMLKDEPDDLTHLAPTAGDACIPLEETGQFFNDVFDDFMIPESYTSLLQDELCSLDSAEHRLGSPASIVGLSVASPITINGTTITTISHHHHSNTNHNNNNSNSSNNSNINNNSSLSSPSSITSSPVSLASPSSISSRASSSSSSGIGSAGSTNSVGGVGPSSGQAGASSNDPFINYRDEIGEISHSPHLLSPELSKSPEGSSIPSLCSPNGSGCPEDELAFMTLNMDDDLDLSMRAPYISMSEVDDLPLLTSEDLMWGAPPTSIEQHASSLAGSTGGSTTLTMAASKYLIKEEFPSHNHNHHQQHQSQPDAKSATVTVNGLRNDLNGSNGSIDSENNCNIGNKIIDSSLAALLCGNVINIQTSTIQLQQQQQQQQSQNGSNNRQILIQQQPQQQVLVSEVQQQREAIGGEKRIKLIESNLVHPMVVISPGYKTSNTIEAWTMNDLLQLNDNGGSNSGGGSSSANTTGSKLNATLIASIVSKKNSTGNNGSNNNNNRSTPPTTTNGTTILSNKRSLATSDGDDGSSKRVKSSQSSPTSSPQLLQQLMAPSPIPAKAKSKSNKSILEQSADGRWPTAKVNGLQGQSSNSVLMNLLVSGCDNNIPKFPPEILIAEDDTSQSSTQDHNELLEADASDDDDDAGGPPILANPMMCSAAAPLSIQTDDVPPSAILFDRGGADAAPDDDFLMTVSPNLLTPTTDLELWRAIQQGGLDPKQISPAPQLRRFGLPRTPKSLTTTPTAQLEELLLLSGSSPTRGATNLLSVLDPAMAISTLRTDEDSDGQEEDYEMTIPVNEILQNNLI